jgi:hypothetical protein
MVEILKDKGPIHLFDEHFQFGLEKARLLLDALPILAEFATNTKANGTTTVTPQTFLNETKSRKLLVSVHRDFLHSSGRLIHQPWLQIDSIPFNANRTIGVGVQKAKAICALSSQLGKWVAGSDARRARNTIRLPLVSVRRASSSRPASVKPKES